MLLKGYNSESKPKGNVYEEDEDDKDFKQIRDKEIAVNIIVRAS